MKAPAPAVKVVTNEGGNSVLAEERRKKRAERFGIAANA